MNPDRSPVFRCFGYLAELLGKAIATISLATLSNGEAAESGKSRLVSQPALEGSLVVDGDGALWHWGNGGARPHRIDVPGVERWESAFGGYYCLALDSRGRLWGWHPTGNGTITAPEQLAMPTHRWRKVTAVATVDTTGDAWKWQQTAPPAMGEPLFKHFEPTPIPRPPGVGRWLDVAGGRGHSVLLADSGRVFVQMLGSDAAGVGGPLAGTQVNEQFVEVPTPLAGHRWQAIAAGSALSFGRLDTGEWYWWGRGFSVFNGTTSIYRQPTPTLLRRPAGVLAWSKVVAGEGFILMLSDAGLTYGLGDNSVGQLAYPGGHVWSRSYEAEPLRIFPVTPVAQRVADLTAGYRHALALGEDGLVYTWGINDRGELGRAVSKFDWRPGQVQGTTSPFSPAAPGLPQFELVAVQPFLKGPHLAGAANEPARYEIRRRGGPDIAVYFSPGIVNEGPFFNRRPLAFSSAGSRFLTGVQIPAGVTTLPLEVTGLFDNSFAGNRDPYAFKGTLKANGPLWAEWVNGNDAPITITYPAPWTYAPTGEIDRAGTLAAGVQTATELSFSDRDGWVTGWELWGSGADETGGPPTLIASREGLRGLPSIINLEKVFWVPPRPQTNYQLTLVLHDNGGSVTTNVSQYWQIHSGRRFGANWINQSGVQELPGSGILNIRELYADPSNPAVDAKAVVRGANFIITSLPLSLPLQPEAIPLSARTREVVIEITTQGGQTWRETVSGAIYATTGGPAVVTIETEDGDAHETALDPAWFVLRRYGGDLGKPLAVSVVESGVSPGLVPPPRLTEVNALRNVDYRLVPERLEFPAGIQSIRLKLEPFADGELEGNEGVSIVLMQQPDYEVVIEKVAALAVIHDDDLRVELPHPVVSGIPQRIESAQRLFTSSWQAAGIGEPWSKLEWRLGETLLPKGASIPGPLPLGPLSVRARVTDRFGQVVESEPVTLEITPTLRVLNQKNLVSGTNLWRLSVQPELQPITLESSDDFQKWQPVQPLFVTPTNRTTEVLLPAAASRFLRLVPAGL